MVRVGGGGGEPAGRGWRRARWKRVDFGLAPGEKRGYFQPMKDLVLTLPGEALAAARIPPDELERELRRRLAAALYSDGIVGGAAACRLAGMEKAEFQHWLGERGIEQPLGVDDYQLERENFHRLANAVLASACSDDEVEYSEADLRK